jgi:hypothetical protein
VARAKGLCDGHDDRMRAGLSGPALEAPFSPRPSRKHLNLCETEGCERRVYAHGVCRKHYERAWRKKRAAIGVSPRR